MHFSKLMTASAALGGSLLVVAAPTPRDHSQNSLGSSVLEYDPNASGPRTSIYTDSKNSIPKESEEGRPRLSSTTSLADDVEEVKKPIIAAAAPANPIDDVQPDAFDQLGQVSVAWANAIKEARNAKAAGLEPLTKEEHRALEKNAGDVLSSPSFVHDEALAQPFVELTKVPNDDPALRPIAKFFEENKDALIVAAQSAQSVQKAMAAAAADAKLRADKGENLKFLDKKQEPIPKDQVEQYIYAYKAGEGSPDFKSLEAEMADKSLEKYDQGKTLENYYGKWDPKTKSFVPNAETILKKPSSEEVTKATGFMTSLEEETAKLDKMFSVEASDSLLSKIYNYIRFNILHLGAFFEDPRVTSMIERREAKIAAARAARREKLLKDEPVVNEFPESVPRTEVEPDKIRSASSLKSEYLEDGLGPVVRIDGEDPLLLTEEQLRKIKDENVEGARQELKVVLNDIKTYYETGKGDLQEIFNRAQKTFRDGADSAPKDIAAAVKGDKELEDEFKRYFPSDSYGDMLGDLYETEAKQNAEKAADEAQLAEQKQAKLAAEDRLNSVLNEISTYRAIQHGNPEAILRGGSNAFKAGADDAAEKLAAAVKGDPRLEHYFAKAFPGPANAKLLSEAKALSSSEALSPLKERLADREKQSAVEGLEELKNDADMDPAIRAQKLQDILSRAQTAQSSGAKDVQYALLNVAGNDHALRQQIMTGLEKPSVPAEGSKNLADLIKGNAGSEAETAAALENLAGSGKEKSEYELLRALQEGITKGGPEEVSQGVKEASSIANKATSEEEGLLNKLKAFVAEHEV